MNKQHKVSRGKFWFLCQKTNEVKTPETFCMRLETADNEYPHVCV